MLTLSYTQSSRAVLDVVGNRLSDVSSQSISANDIFPPTFTASRTGIDTIVLTFDEDVDTDLTGGEGWSLSTGQVTANTDPNNSTTMTLTTTGITGTTATPTVTYSITTGDVVDRNNNEIADGTSTEATDSVGPNLLFESVSPASGTTAKVDDPIIVVIRSEDGENDLVQGTNVPTINGVIAIFSNDDNGLYSFTIMVSEGGTDVSDATEPLTINLLLNDANGNVGTNSIGEIPANSAPGIDANMPTYTVETVTPASDNIVGIDQTIEIVIQAGNSEEGLVFTSPLTINGVTATSTDDGGGRYTIIAQIVEGGTDILDTAVLPVNIQLQDAAGNLGELIENIDADTAPGIDANSPEISFTSISPTNGNTAAVGDPITITFTATGTDHNLTAVGTPTINGNAATLTSSGNTYTLTTTVLEGHNDILDSAALPISITLQDPAGHPSNTINEVASRPSTRS